MKAILSDILKSQMTHFLLVIGCIWLKYQSYEYFLNSYNTSYGATRRIIIFFWPFSWIFVLISFEIYSPKCKSYVKEIIMQKKYQVVYKNLFQHVLSFWLQTKIFMHGQCTHVKNHHQHENYLIWIVGFS